MIRIAPHRVLPLMPGETTTSFFTRMAMDIGLPIMPLSRFVGTSFYRIVEGDRGAMDRVGEAFHVDPALLRDRSIPLVGTRRYQLGRDSVPREALNRSELRVCPECIREDLATGFGTRQVRPYLRHRWHVASIHVCERHEVQLLVASRENRPHLIHDAAYRLNLAREAIEQAPVVKAFPGKLETYLMTRLDGVSTSAWLDGLDFHAAARICEVIGIAEVFGIRAPWTSLDIGQKRHAASVGFEIAHDGVTGIDRWLTTLTKLNFDYKTAWGLKLVYGRLYEWLSHDGIQDLALDPLRRVMHDHIVSNLPLGPKDKIFRWPIAKRKVHSVFTLANEYDLPIRTVRRRGAIAGILTDDPELTDDRIYMDADAGEALAKELRALYKAHGNYTGPRPPRVVSVPRVRKPKPKPQRRVREGLTLADVVRRLNLPRGHDHILIDAGYLNPLPSYLLGTYSFDPKEVADFWDRLSAKVKSPTPAGLVPMRRASKMAKCNAIQIIDLLYEGRLERVGQSKSVAGYEGLLVCPKEILPLVVGPALTGLTLKQVEATLKTPSRVINALLAEGILPSEVQKNPINRCDQTVVLPQVLEAFMSEYASAYALSLEWNFGARGVVARLRSAGIEPAFDPDLVRASFYRRRDLPPPKDLGI
jgi:hypothetical protein